jgi:hypothetical protein
MLLSGLQRFTFHKRINLPISDIILGTQKEIIPHLACLLARLFAYLVRYIHRHVSRYAPLDVPCRRTQIRRNLVELFLAVTLNVSEIKRL